MRIYAISVSALRRIEDGGIPYTKNCVSTTAIQTDKGEIHAESVAREYSISVFPRETHHNHNFDVMDITDFIIFAGYQRT